MYRSGLTLTAPPEPLPPPISLSSSRSVLLPQPAAHPGGSLVSKSIKQLVVGPHASWLNPFATHPALRIGLTRDSKELYRWVPAKPRSLPKDEYDPREAEALWKKNEKQQ